MCALSRALSVVGSWRYQIPLGLTLSTCLFLFLSSRWTCVLVQRCDLDTLNRLSSSAPVETSNSLGVPLPSPAKLTAQSLCALIYQRGLLVVLPHRIVVKSRNQILCCPAASSVGRRLSQWRLFSYSPNSLRSANIYTLPMPVTCQVRVHRRFPALKALLGVRKQNKESGNKQQDNYNTSSDKCYGGDKQ